MKPEAAPGRSEHRASGRLSPRAILVVLAVGELLTRGVSLLAFAHLARTLGADGFGKLEFVLAWLMFGMVMVEWGSQTIGARDVALDEDAAPGLLAKISADSGR